MSNTQNNKPAAKLRDGAVVATIWKRDTVAGSFHSVEFSRIYKNKDGNFRDATSFSNGDLLRLSFLAEETYRHLRFLKQQSRNSGKTADLETKQ